ncbi:hypothetical protein KAFR_0B00360 [Kazachstania africana CBS 2517]|uniref:HDA1 complex subunit 3 n=1 Tax=Kazachstania africana (strain ATCC 22294 / BCRC 22015 / CBS 2517 / CECT 1963 / NBRC 1671 / NRRL Y-8276) TaxID=1071382 RepID=H2APN6_KAZAF|nr:hypothetical protein KAFR_0B00360 [Kazachstania africana CBS 2517]CCF56336.1 hypothetical protein KAFR_0B00360 [Kazachstania africana CBS 2517]
MDLLKILDTKPIPTIVDSQSLGVSGDVSGDYWLPTTMCLYQKKLTDEIISLHYSDILKYFETDDYKEDVILGSMRTMCLNSEYVATHPYLLIEHHMPKTLTTRDIPINLADTSGKFTVLRDLMTLVQEYETNTALVCRPGRTMDLLEALLLGNKVNIKRYDGRTVKSQAKQKKTKAKQSCTVHLFPSQDLDLQKFPINEKHHFDMLIAVDPTVDTNVDFIQEILTFSRDQSRNENKAPIVRLVTINSIDHCDLYFSKKFNKGSKDFLESTTAAVVVLRDSVGTLPPDLRPIYSQQLHYLTEWLEDPSLPWPLPDIYPLKRYNSMDVERSLLNEVNFNEADDLETAFANNSKKRHRHPDETTDVNKKDGPTKSFYELKRLKNDYLANPINQGMANLAGIVTGNVKDSINYHLSSNILTHKLIQIMGQVYVDINRETQELDDYSTLNGLENDHVSFYQQEKETMSKKLQTRMDEINESNEKSISMEFTNKEKFELIEKIEIEIEGLLKKVEAKDTGLKNLFISVGDLKDEIDKETRQNESKLTEKEYMEKEIERAQTATNELEVEMEKVLKDFENVQNELREIKLNQELKKDGAIERIENLKRAIVEEKLVYDDLESKLNSLVGKLKNFPPPRIRVTTNTTRRRK